MATRTLNGTKNDDEIVAAEPDLFVISARAGDDVVTIEAENGHTIKLGKGNDTFVADVAGDSNADAGGTVSGGDGNDLFDVSTLSTFLDGGAGNDVFIYSGSALGLNQYVGGDGRDRVDFSAFVALGPELEGLSVNLGEAAISTSAGGREALISIEDFVAGDFDDELIGSGKSNRLDGGAGDDIIDGGRGSDILIGRLGLDFLTGGVGADTFVFGKLDIPTEGETVADFSHQEGDLLDFSRIDGDQERSGRQALKFIGDDDFSGNGRGQLRLGADGAVEADLDGDGNPDFALSVISDGNRDLARDDFIL
jgi:serralysin